MYCALSLLTAHRGLLKDSNCKKHEAVTAHKVAFRLKGSHTNNKTDFKNPCLLLQCIQQAVVGDKAQ